MGSTCPHFAIVGGGLSGLASLNGLVESLTSLGLKGAKITVFEPSGIVGPGVPYRIDQPYCWLLNHEADHMGTLNGGDGGFLAWIAANRKVLSKEYAQAMEREWVPTNPNDHLIAVDAKAFYPRTLFGRFLKFCFHDIQDQAARNGIEVIVVPHAVQAMDEQPNKLLAVRDAEGNDYLFDQAVLTSGHTYSPSNPQFSAKSTHLSNIYIDAQRNALASKNADTADPSSIPHLGTVAIKGTGLSANDAAMWLLEQRGLGNLTFDRIVMASRRGQLRKARVKTGKYQLQYLTQDVLEARVKSAGNLSLDWILPLARKEMEAAYGGKSLDWQDIWNPRTADIQKHLAASVKEAECGRDIPWRSMLMALSEVRQYIFSHLTREDKRRYFTELCTLYLSYQAPMPAVSAKRLLKAMEDGLLKVEAGLCGIETDSETGKYCLTFLTGDDGRPVLTHGLKDDKAPPPGAKVHHMEADYLIEATGQTRDPRHFPKPYPRMFEAGLLRAHSWGGFHVEPESRQLIRANGELWENAWQLGVNNQGDVLISSNAPNNIADGLRIGLCMINQWEEQRKSGRAQEDIVPMLSRRASSFRELDIHRVIHRIINIFNVKAWY